ncbi:AraC family transcriptional regulator [Leucobacter sp. wl10]|uniref:helix-turn-helix domain-containing protein n=1 Tax=Leucobacter sp. wl10 TaxID=2304677 RepID=UPI000E5A2A66|nr:AraC family transcriptional regulator [Leucobacter sp. wl10]RGE19839.1 AraC family transcriptional regulator [Leucobacter sp. wl10]
MTEPARDDPGPGAWRREPSTVMRPPPPAPAEPAGPFVILAESEVAGTPLEWEPHAHPMHELAWVRGGTMTVRIGARIFTVPEGRGLWLPAGATHAGRLTARAELSDAFFAPDRTPVAFEGPTTIAMSPLLESLLLHLSRGDLDAAARSRAESVVFDVLEPAEQQFALRLPGDARVDPIAEALLDDPADGRGLDEWASALGISERTVTRAFRRSTGLSFAQWRRVLRVHLALKLLAEGGDVAAVSDRLGYAQPSTFIAAFRQVMGTTPGSFMGRASAPHNMSENPYPLS